MAFGCAAAALIACAAHALLLVGFRAHWQHPPVGEGAVTTWADVRGGHVTDKHGFSSKTTPLCDAAGQDGLRLDDVLHLRGSASLRHPRRRSLSRTPHRPSWCARSLVFA